MKCCWIWPGCDMFYRRREIFPLQASRDLKSLGCAFRLGTHTHTKAHGTWHTVCGETVCVCACIFIYTKCGTRASTVYANFGLHTVMCVRCTVCVRIIIGSVFMYTYTHTRALARALSHTHTHWLCDRRSIETLSPFFLLSVSLLISRAVLFSFPPHSFVLHLYIHICLWKRNHFSQTILIHSYLVGGSKCMRARNAYERAKEKESDEQKVKKHRKWEQ